MSEVELIRSDTLSSSSDSDYFQLLPQVQEPEFFRMEKGGTRKRKRRCINPSFMPEIRILRRDIRRQYAAMIINVANSHDLSLLQKFCNEIFRPDCQVIRPNPPKNLVSKAVSELVYDEVSHYGNFSGSHYLVNECSFIYEMMPDCIFLLQEAHIRLKQGFGGSIITIKLSSRGTQAFRIEPEKSQMNSLPIVPPIYTTSESVLTLILDEENRVQRFNIATEELVTHE